MLYIISPSYKLLQTEKILKLYCTDTILSHKLQVHLGILSILPCLQLFATSYTVSESDSESYKYQKTCHSCFEDFLM